MKNLSYFTELQKRCIISVKGSDAEQFLQGLITNNIQKANATLCLWAAILSPQGKFLHEFIVSRNNDGFLLDCELDRNDDLLNIFKKFKLKANIFYKVESELNVGAAWGNITRRELGITEKLGCTVQNMHGVIMQDPRLFEAGIRIIGTTPKLSEFSIKLKAELVDNNSFDEHRIKLGLPDGGRDMTVGKALLLENGFQELNGVDFKKGCYIGQEVTARTFYRTLIKKRLIPVVINGPTPKHGSTVMLNGKAIGEMKTSNGGFGLALIKLDLLTPNFDGPLSCEAATITPKLPTWLNTKTRTE
jgi:folate-binding protein YgfZ